MIFHGTRSHPIPIGANAQVQRASYGGIGVVTEAAHVEDDARRAAGFALGVEQQVHQQLEEAKRQAREEADWGLGAGGKMGKLGKVDDGILFFELFVFTGWMMGEMGCIDLDLL